jgi:hypothetical protein
MFFGGPRYFSRLTAAPLPSAGVRLRPFASNKPVPSFAMSVRSLLPRMESGRSLRFRLSPLHPNRRNVWEWRLRPQFLQNLHLQNAEAKWLAMNTCAKNDPAGQPPRMSTNRMSFAAFTKSGSPSGQVSQNLHLHEARVKWPEMNTYVKNRPAGDPPRTSTNTMSLVALKESSGASRHPQSRKRQWPSLAESALARGAS